MLSKDSPVNLRALQEGYVKRLLAAIKQAGTGKAGEWLDRFLELQGLPLLSTYAQFAARRFHPEAGYYCLNELAVLFPALRGDIPIVWCEILENQGEYDDEHLTYMKQEWRDRPFQYVQASSEERVAFSDALNIHRLVRVFDASCVPCLLLPIGDTRG